MDLGISKMVRKGRHVGIEVGEDKNSNKNSEIGAVRDAHPAENSQIPTSNTNQNKRKRPQSVN